MNGQKCLLSQDEISLIKSRRNFSLGRKNEFTGLLNKFSLVLNKVSSELNKFRSNRKRVNLIRVMFGKNVLTSNALTNLKEIARRKNFSSFLSHAKKNEFLKIENVTISSNHFETSEQPQTFLHFLKVSQKNNKIKFCHSETPYKI
jgi:hypothetical protein